MCAQINRLQVGCTTDYTTRPKCMKPNALDTLGDKKPCLHVEDGQLIWLQGVVTLHLLQGYEP